MKQCYSVKRDGNKCRNLTLNDVSSECRANVGYCNRDVEMYHKICDRVWNVDCSKLNKKEILRILEDIEVCRYMRGKHTNLCISPECRDKGHTTGVIRKLANVESYCSDSLLSEQQQELSPEMQNFATYLQSVGAFLHVDYRKEEDLYYLTVSTPHFNYKLVSVGDTIEEASRGIINAWYYAMNE